MRLVGQIAHENEAQKFCAYMDTLNMTCSIEPLFEADGSVAYQIWAHEEDRIDEAKRLLETFLKEPHHDAFVAPVDVPVVEEQPFAHKTYLTTLVLCACAMLFLLCSIDSTPFEMNLLYGEPGEALFGKIREGQVWRLVTPVFLHKDLLHILFNMLWVWYLGRPIEQRIGPARFGLLMLLCAIGSNTVQYLMSGPLFIGYSGVVTGMAGFIWTREKLAPWEGYPLTKGTILFLLVFIMAISVLQAISFLLSHFAGIHFLIGIANSAHIGGAIIGALLGRMRFFAREARV